MWAGLLLIVQLITPITATWNFHMCRSLQPRPMTQQNEQAIHQNGERVFQRKGRHCFDILYLSTQGIRECVAH